MCLHILRLGQKWLCEVFSFSLQQIGCTFVYLLQRVSIACYMTCVLLFTVNYFRNYLRNYSLLNNVQRAIIIAVFSRM